MKKYISPEMEIIYFSNIMDIVTLSNNTDPSKEPSKDWTEMINGAF